MIPSLIAVATSFLFLFSRPKSLNFLPRFFVFLGLLSFAGALFAMTAHTGVHEAVSPWAHPSYPLALLGSVLLVALR